MKIGPSASLILLYLLLILFAFRTDGVSVGAVTRVDGQNQYCHIVCNPLYTAYLTTPNKDRLTIVDVLRNGRERSFLLNAEALSYLERMSLVTSHREQLHRLPHDELMDRTTVEHLPSRNPPLQQPG